MPLVTYSLLRIGLVLASVGVLWFVGVRHWALLIGFGVVIGAALSYVLLARQRDATVVFLQQRNAARQEAGEDEAVEDAAVEGALEGEPEPEEHPVAERDEPRSTEHG